MLLPITLTLAYLAINFAIIVWIERERARGRPPSQRVVAWSWAVRFVPPLVGLIYLETLAGDWLFLVFVAAFFALAFWLMDGLLSTTMPRRGSEPMRRGWDDRRSDADPDRS
jgi:hypothetical protein